MTSGVVLLVSLAVVGGIAAALIGWNNRQRELGEAPPRRHRDLNDRIDHVVSGARDVSDRAVRVAAAAKPGSIESSWEPVRADMLAIEGDIVNLGVHVGEAPIGLSLADLDRAVHALRDAVERHLELRAADPADEHALGLSQDVVGQRRRAVDAALDQVAATRP